MGFRFRKSTKIAPGVKVNFGKKSAGVTFGGKGFHYTINSKGRKTTSVNVPGTGLSYQKTISSSKKSKDGESSPGCLKICLLVLFFPIVLAYKVVKNPEMSIVKKVLAVVAAILFYIVVSYFGGTPA